MQSTTHKIGDTYQRIGRYNLGAGTWAATSAVWGYGAALEHVKVQDLTVSLVALGSPDVDGNTHALTVSATSGETALWPEALLASDIVFTESAVVRSSEMYQIISGRWASGSDSDNPLAVIPSELLPVTQGATGAGVPDGGTTGQVLAKATDDDQDTEWVDPGAVTVDAVPTNGSTNAVSSNGVFDALATKAVAGANSDITSLSGVVSAQFGDGSAEASAAGKLWYNGTTGAWNLGMGGGNITQQIGEEFFTYGKASAAITDSPIQAVYRTGAVGVSGVITFGPTVAGITDANLIVGISTESIANNAFGRVTTNGIVRSIDTSGAAYSETWADNDTIWYNPTTGGLTNVMPTAPGLQLSVGSIIKAHAASGMVQVKLSHANTTAADIAAIVNAASSKTTPVDADAFAGIDSAASFGLKKFTWANIKATLKTYFDTLYQPLAANLTSWAGIAPAAKQDVLVSGANIKTVNSTSLLGSGDIAVIASIAPLVIADANTIDQRNGTAAQTYRLYNAYTDASNYERGFMRWNSNVFEIGAEAGGTGVHRASVLSSSAMRITVSTSADSTGISVTNNPATVEYARLTNSEFMLQGIPLRLSEQTAPAAPATNEVRIYAEDNGSGKTRLMALFATGAAVQIAIEP